MRSSRQTQDAVRRYGQSPSASIGTVLSRCHATVPDSLKTNSRDLTERSLLVVVNDVTVALRGGGRESKFIVEDQQ